MTNTPPPPGPPSDTELKRLERLREHHLQALEDIERRIEIEKKLQVFDVVKVVDGRLGVVVEVFDNDQVTVLWRSEIGTSICLSRMAPSDLVRQYEHSNYSDNLIQFIEKTGAFKP